MSFHRREELLARTDPFDLAQAVDRYVHTLPGERIRALLLDARERMGAYYRDELVQMLEPVPGHVDSERFAEIISRPWSDQALQSAFARLLKGNLRAIGLFGAAFTDGVLEYVPTDRAVGIGEEPAPAAGRALIFAAIAVALLVAGAAGEHYLAGVRAQVAALPAPQSVALPPVGVVSPTPVPEPTLAATPQPHVTVRPRPTLHPATPAPPTAAPATAPPTAPATVAPATAAPAPRATPVRRAAPVRPAKKRFTPPPPARGVATIAIPQATPGTPAPEPSALDVTDMPQSYTDATPIPRVTTVPLTVPHNVSLVTPTAAPPHHSWLVRQVEHLDPFKPSNGWVHKTLKHLNPFKGKPQPTPTP